MENLYRKLQYSDWGAACNNLALFCFRTAVSLELIFVHGLKKIGIGTQAAEVVPNPLGFPYWFNRDFAITANLFMPILVILGFQTRLATLPILAVTLTGYFVVHAHDTALVKDTPLMYSLCYLFILWVGAGRYALDARLARRHFKKTNQL